MNNIFIQMLSGHRANIFADNPNNIVSNNTLSGIIQNKIGHSENDTVVKNKNN